MAASRTRRLKSDRNDDRAGQAMGAPRLLPCRLCSFSRWLQSGLAAVDGNRCSTDERSLVGCDKKNSLGDFFRTAQALERNTGNEVGLLIVRPGEACEHFRFDRARSDDINPDAEWSPFQSCRFSESLDRMLA